MFFCFLLEHFKICLTHLSNYMTPGCSDWAVMMSVHCPFMLI